MRTHLLLILMCVPVCMLHTASLSVAAEICAVTPVQGESHNIIHNGHCTRPHAGRRAKILSDAATYVLLPWSPVIDIVTRSAASSSAVVS